MFPGRSMTGLRPVVLLALVAFAFWRPLFTGATLGPEDQLWLDDPFNAEPPVGLTVEVAERDAIAVHSNWVGFADAVRSGEVAWWTEAGAGRPTLADGLPFTHLAYLVVPAWYASGLVASLAVLVAAFGAMRLADRRGLVPLAGLFAGIGFGFSGVMFVWIGWPHATALALAPWVVAALLDVLDDPVPRRVGFAAAVIAAQLWCGVFAIAVFTLVGALVWAALLAPRGRGRAIGVAASVCLGGALAAPHLWPRWERWSWADTSHLEVGDTSAPLLSVITTAIGSALGNESVGVAWISSGSFQLSVGFVGVATIVLVPLGLCSGSRPLAPAIVGGIGVAVAYVGGPFASLAALAIGDAGLASHARVLVVLAAVMLGAAGVDLVVRGTAPADRMRVAWAATGVVGAVTAVVWLKELRDASSLRAVGATAVGSLAALVIAVVVVRGWHRRRVTGVGAGAALAALVAYELLSFGMPIPTVTDRDERVAPTEAHETLGDLLGETGRVSGDHDAFSPSDSARFGFADVRAPGLRSSAEIDAFVAVDPSSTLGALGGGPFEPVVRVRGDADPSTSPLWDLLGVDAWVLPRDAAPPGRRVDPVPDARSPAAAASPIGRIVVPDGGLRGIVLDLAAPVFSTVSLEVTTDAATVAREVVLRSARDGLVPIAVQGEDLVPGVEARVVVTVDSGEQPAEIGTIAGVVAVGTVAGAVDSELIWTDGVLILARPTPRAVWDGPGSAEVDIVVDEPGRLVVHVVNGSEGLLRSDLLAEPGWAVRVDGVDVGERIVEDLVLGADLDSGSHRVEFEYFPPRFTAGLVIAALGLALWALWAVADRRRASPS